MRKQSYFSIFFLQNFLQDFSYKMEGTPKTFQMKTSFSKMNNLFYLFLAFVLPRLNLSIQLYFFFTFNLFISSSHVYIGKLLREDQ